MSGEHAAVWQVKILTCTLRSLNTYWRESPTTRATGGADLSAIGGEKQRHASVLIGAGATVYREFVQSYNRVQSARFEKAQLSWHES
jgi:hypothetical protein